ncbi:actin patch protein [Ophiostoma piceae UAMH 11346]|uniref:Actin patch protein n=1 Tax=Ophiostoma piceae (strain UAMH 11346) TaxID=1262450 RepID=S3CEF7_OPHP1|nr:actin patch protein [Ophiostoma piceae UAMH 11346]
MSNDYQMYERGSRRRRLAAMANNVYRAGVAAASEIRDQYNTSRAIRESDGSGSEWEEDRPPNIPGAFPDVSFATGGDAQMVLFPMYAKRHVRRFKPSGAMLGTGGYASDDSERAGEPPNWHQEFARLEDEKAVVDVNVHGWLYIVNQGPLTRKNRLLIGLARRLSGVPAPEQAMLSTDATGMPAGVDGSIKDPHEALKIQRAAEAIERRGQGEKDAAARGEYSETPDQAARYDDSSSDDGLNHARRPPPPAPGPGKLTPKSSWPASSIASTAATPEMSEAEMIAANTNLLSRLGPFLTTPVVQQPVTLFFYNEDKSQSRTVLTTDSGHFVTCASLDFVPTHVRILVASGSGNSVPKPPGGGAAGVAEYSVASETALVNSLTHPLSAVAPIQLVEDRGISLISDIDDTIKTSNIALGTREIFRNTFVRNLADMTVDGTREWYTALHDLGVQFHYCSNSPWQLFPVLTTFFKRAGLPKGPLHLKQYSGMLQGIFEPVAERKRGTLEKILRDFPNRRFLLVGDSGEADLEVYTELVLAHPGRVLAIFIRDVTTPQQQGYFDSSTSSRTLNPNYGPSSPGPERRPALPARIATAPPQQQQQQLQQKQKPSAPPQGPVMGTLIDLDDTPSSGPPPVTNLSGLPPPPPPPRRPQAGGLDGSGGGADNVRQRQQYPYQRPPVSPQPQQQQQPPVNKKVDMWHRRLAHAQDILAPHGVALYTWRRGQDVAVEAVGIVKRAMRRE